MQVPLLQGLFSERDEDCGSRDAGTTTVPALSRCVESSGVRSVMQALQGRKGECEFANMV